LVFTLFLYFDDTAWLIPSLISYIALGALLFWGNKKVHFVPYDKVQQPTSDT